ncbi:hypothetical protein [Escherichia coli]|uniref:hypothetical protein n=1 Tax=Escherichia coli TaxID=562 RepID=UPI0038B304DE
MLNISSTQKLVNPSDPVGQIPVEQWYRRTYVVSEYARTYTETIIGKAECPCSAAVNGAMAIRNANPSVLSIRFVSIEQLSPEEGEASERALDAWFEKHPEEIE